MLTDILKEYTNRYLPMHMPGGKRRFPSELPYRLDVTEVQGLDDLHQPTGILAEMQTRAARLWGAERSFVLVNGSTCGLLAAVRATGDGAILLARNCHKSVYNAVELCRRPARYLLPENGEITPQSVAQALQDHPEITAAVITSPTYEGVISDIAAIAQICRAHGVTLIVDEAHGAHLGFCFGESAVTLGADIVVQSLHKTLPALTQTAILHCRERFSQAVARELAVFESSSPSYILLASADECFAFLASECGREQMKRYAENIFSVRKRLTNGLAHFRLLDAPRYDSGKLVLLTDGTDCTGVRAAQLLRETYRIETEMALPYSLTAMTSVCDGETELNCFADAVLAIDKTVSCAPRHADVPLSLPEQVCPAYELHGREGVALPIGSACGRISLDYVWAYPPGVPLLAPGERVDETVLQTVRSLRQAGISVQGETLRVL